MKVEREEGGESESETLHRQTDEARRCTQLIKKETFLFQWADREWIWQGINLSAGNTMTSRTRAHTPPHGEEDCRVPLPWILAVAAHHAAELMQRCVLHLSFHYITVLTFSNMLCVSTQSQKGCTHKSKVFLVKRQNCVALGKVSSVRLLALG